MASLVVAFFSFAAFAVGCFNYYVSQGQLAVMKEQATFTKVQLAPQIRLDHFFVGQAAQSDPSAGILITPSFINSGGTTAKHVITMWTIVIKPSNLDPHQFCGFPKSTRAKSAGFDVEPQQPTEMQSLTVPTIAIQGALLGTVNIIMTAHIEYGNLFDKETQTLDWCISLTPNPNNPTDFSYPMLSSQAN